MKKTKQQIIEHLEQSLRDEIEKRAKLERIIDDVKREFFGDADPYGTYRHRRDGDDILSEARRLKIKISTLESGENRYLMSVENESERLWRLVRSLTADPTLILEIEHELKHPMVDGREIHNSCR